MRVIITITRARLVATITTILYVLQMTSSALIQLKLEHPNKQFADLISPDQCWQIYPYTYSKCLRLCLTSKEATCLDDQLCYCNLPSVSYDLNNSNENFNNEIRAEESGQNSETLVPDINAQFGTSPVASCYFSDFCEELCQRDEKLSRFYYPNEVSGALCKLSEFTDENGRSYYEDIDTCVCANSKIHI